MDDFTVLSGKWTQKTDFPGEARYQAVGFSIGNKGYIGTGYNGGKDRNDFWEYNPTTDQWTQKADFAGGARINAVGFSIGNKGYIGTGSDGTYKKEDFWEFDPETNQWTQKADFPGSGRSSAAGFSIGNKGYIGTGFSGSSLSIDIGYEKDFWEYDPVTDQWTQKANLPEAGRYNAVGFSIGDKG